MDISDLTSHVVKTLQEHADEVTHATAGEGDGELHFLTARFGDQFFSVVVRQSLKAPTTIS